MTNFDINYNVCEPTVCSDDIRIRILNYQDCVEYGDNITISWTIDNNDKFPMSNNILWSFNNETFSNTVITENNEEPYYGFIDAPLTQGLLYFKIKSNINGTFYESSVCTINISNNCGANTNIIPVKICNCISNSNPFNNLWIEEKGFPIIIDETVGIYTIYFDYNNNCYYIDNECYSNKQLVNDDPNKTILNFNDSIISFNYFDCDDCCKSNNCYMKDFDSGINTNNGDVYFLEVGETNCITVQHKSYYSNKSIRIIVSNSDTGEILYNSGYTTDANWIKTDISVNNIINITVTVITNLDEIIKWRCMVNCCD